MDYIAHKTDEKIQTVKEHSENVAKMAADFSISSLSDFIYNIGLLHDVGKYQLSFQKRINDSSIKIAHAACGATASADIPPRDILTLIMQYCIAGHHSGLHDIGTMNDDNEKATLYGNLVRETEDFSFYKDELSLKSIDKQELYPLIAKNCMDSRDVKKICENIDFVTRYCFSCLTDADSLDTEEFMIGKSRETYVSDFGSTLKSIDDLFMSFKAITKLQKARSAIQSQVYTHTNDTNNFFILNMPTGSGKTLCSLKFALERAEKLKRKRIIYVIPYNSIIDQTAELFEKTFDKLNILRHQSSFTYEDFGDEDYKVWSKKSTENWDADFIITTAVQFFESIYKNKRGKLRRLHNMADSIIIFDEAHLMPIKYLEPCIKSIINITDFLNSDALLLTATMPDFDKLINERFNTKVNITDLISDKSLFSQFKKCSYKYKTFSDVENLILHSDEVTKLIIVNNKKLAQNIYKKCAGEVYHLSTYMTGIDRVNTINTIKSRIKQLEIDFKSSGEVPANRKITVVSTSLIEAGVDLDFHTVYREISGLDSILQSGGRCNREGKRKNGEVIVFELEYNKKAFSDEQNFAKSLFDEFLDIDCEQCIKTYYDRLFERKQAEISSNCVYKDGRKPYEIDFETYAKNFKFIDDSMVSIVIPLDDYSSGILENSKHTGFVNSRLVQKYVVNIALYEFETLLKQGAISDFGTGVYFLTNSDYYDRKIGIGFEGKDYYVEGGSENGIWI